MLSDYQDFPIHDPFGHHHGSSAAPPSLLVDVNEVKLFLPREEPYAEFYRGYATLQANLATTEWGKDAKEIAESEEKLKFMTTFRPLMNGNERVQMLFTVAVFLRACARYSRH